MKHTKTIEACKRAGEKEWGLAGKLFLEAAEEIENQLTASVQGYHIVFVLDRSYSMVTLYNIQLCETHVDMHKPICVMHLKIHTNTKGFQEWCSTHLPTHI